jgi:uncharacterized alpha-E superfamily protein
MLARIAHELYWLGRNLARAEFTARAVDGVFRAELQSAAETEPGVRFGSNDLLAMLGGDARETMLVSVERAREGARTVRDVISAEMWEAINATTLSLRRDAAASRQLPGGAYQASQYVKQRTALIWGIAERAMLRDEAKRFLDAGGLIEVADMVLRMLRVALPSGGGGGGRAGSNPEDARADGNAFALLQAVGGFHAYLRAVTAPPNAQPVARFLLFERAYPDSVAACVDSLHEAFAAADASPHESKPVLRVSRLAADLEFQRRALPDGAELLGICERVQLELARVDQDVADRYFAGAGDAAGERGLLASDVARSSALALSGGRNP